MPDMIAARHLRKAYGPTLVLEDISLELAAGQCLALLGPNGAGKTTLLRILATLSRPSSGELAVAGEDALKRPEAARAVIGVVAHGSYVYEDLSALENLHFWTVLGGGDASRERLHAALTQVELDAVAHERVRTFSAGMKRRLALARVILGRARLLLLDEPFTGLDQQGRKWLSEFLLAFKAGGGAVVVATHSFGSGLGVADRMTILVAGRLMVDRACGDLSREDIRRLYDSLADGDGAASSVPTVTAGHSKPVGCEAARDATSEASSMSVERRAIELAKPWAFWERPAGYARRAWIVLWKDLLAERRSKESMNALLFFSLLLLLLFEFALGPDRERLRSAMPGLLWLGFILAGLLGLGRSFMIERANDCWEGLRLSPGDKSAIYLGKLLGNLFTMAAVEVVLLGLFGFFYDVDLTPALGPLAIVLVLGTLGLSAVGTLFAAMTAQVRARELLFPVLLLPAQVPLLLATVSVTQAVLLGWPLAQVGHWLQLLAVADLVYVVVGVLTFEFILDA